MLKVEFGADDLAHMRFASSPILTLLRALFVGGLGRLSPSHRRWWQNARRLIPGKAGPLFELINASPTWTPGLLVPELPETASRRSVEDELDALRALPESFIATDLATFPTFAGHRPMPRILAELGANGTSSVPALADAVRLLFNACLATDWPAIRRHIGVEIAMRAQQMATDGPVAAINSLHPRLSWHAGTLLFDTSDDWPVELDLGGRGIVFLPAVPGLDGGAYIQTLITRQRQPLLSYTSGYRLSLGAAPTGSALATLIGAGRARALRMIGTGASTAELAARLGVQAPTASAHAAALRTAGLVVTVREGRSVRHCLTDLGAGLLAANP